MHTTSADSKSVVSATSTLCLVCNSRAPPKRVIYSHKGQSEFNGFGPWWQLDGEMQQTMNYTTV